MNHSRFGYQQTCIGLRLSHVETVATSRTDTGLSRVCQNEFSRLWPDRFDWDFLCRSDHRFSGTICFLVSTSRTGHNSADFVVQHLLIAYRQPSVVSGIPSSPQREASAFSPLFVYFAVHCLLILRVAVDRHV